MEFEMAFEFETGSGRECQNSKVSARGFERESGSVTESGRELMQQLQYSMGFLEREFRLVE